MAHILIVSRGLPSVVYPSVELGRRLVAAGHRLTFAGAPDDRALVEHHGLKLLPLASDGYEAFLRADARSDPLRRVLRLQHRRALAVESTAVAGFVDAVGDLAPDLLLVNGEMHEHIIAASRTGIPVALLNTFVSIWRQPGLPPPHHLVRPGVGWKGTRLGTSLLWSALRLRKWRKALSLKVRRVGCDRVSVLRQLARDAGFDFRAETDTSQWLIPFTYRRHPVLSLHALEFEFSHRPPDRVRYVGPMVLESRIGHALTRDDQMRLDEVVDRRRASGGARTLIYAGFGSAFSTDLGLLRRLIQAVEMRVTWELVVSLGGRVSPSAVGAIPERVHVFSWVPQLSVLRHADAVVTHGGINTIDECVTCGVPVLVYCGAETDMAGTTARVVYHGIGLAGDRRRDEAPHIRAHLDRLLGDMRFAHNVGRLRARYTAYAAQRVAERAVDSLLEGRRVSGTALRDGQRAVGGEVQ